MQPFNGSQSSSRDTAPASPPLAVLKFGSSVLGSEDDLRRACVELKEWIDDGHKVVSVVSAFHGVTNALVRQADRYGSGRSPEARALLAGTGELSSASLFALALDHAGIRAAVATPWQIDLRASGDPEDAVLNGLDRVAVAKLLRANDAIVVPGFIALDQGSRVVLLGRGGSDLSAIFLAHALGAEVCRLLKDVDGLYESDPNRAPSGVDAPRRYVSLPWHEAEKLDGGIVQPKAIRAAAEWRRSFEVGAMLRDDPTRVGELAIQFGSSDFSRP